MARMIAGAASAQSITSIIIVRGVRRGLRLGFVQVARAVAPVLQSAAGLHARRGLVFTHPPGVDDAEGRTQEATPEDVPTSVTVHLIMEARSGAA